MSLYNLSEGSMTRKYWDRLQGNTEIDDKEILISIKVDKEAIEWIVDNLYLGSFGLLVVPVFLLDLVVLVLDVQLGVLGILEVSEFQEHGYGPDKQFIVNVFILVPPIYLLQVRNQLLSL